MSSEKNKVILVGYSGHAYVVADILLRTGASLIGYCDAVEKENNPFGLPWYGDFHSDAANEVLEKSSFFIAIGNNKTRREIFGKLNAFSSVNAIDPSAIISDRSTMGASVMVGTGVKINAFASIGNGVICNTGAIIEHECIIADFAHLAPGSVLCGNVSVGENSFIGANAVIKQGIKIGKNVTIGAGSVILKDVADNCTVVGNPGRALL